MQAELAKLKMEKQSLRDKITQLRNPQMLAELNREAGSTPSAPAQSTLTQTWTLVDQCNDGAGIRFRFFDMTGGSCGTWS